VPQLFLRPPASPSLSTRYVENRGQHVRSVVLLTDKPDNGALEAKERSAVIATRVQVTFNSWDVSIALKAPPTLGIFR
jgi:hypothetical protein